MKNEMYILASDETTYNNIVIDATLSDYSFKFPNGLNPRFNDVKKFYHGNSKILLHLFRNEITGKYEMQATTKTIVRSYPQNKNKKIVALRRNWLTNKDLNEYFGGEK